jgi:hypothetical protein
MRRHVWIRKPGGFRQMWVPVKQVEERKKQLIRRSMMHARAAGRMADAMQVPSSSRLPGGEAVAAAVAAPPPAAAVVAEVAQRHVPHPPPEPPGPAPSPEEPAGPGLTLPAASAPPSLAPPRSRPPPPRGAGEHITAHASHCAEAARAAVAISLQGGGGGGGGLASLMAALHQHLRTHLDALLLLVRRPLRPCWRPS